MPAGSTGKESNRQEKERRLSLAVRPLFLKSKYESRGHLNLPENITFHVNCADESGRVRLTEQVRIRIQKRAIASGLEPDSKSVVRPNVKPDADRERKERLAANTTKGRFEMRCTDRGCQERAGTVALEQIGATALNVVDVNIQGSAADRKAGRVGFSRLP